MTARITACALIVHAGPGPAFAAFIAGDGIALGVPGFPQGPATMEPLFDGYANERVILWVPVRSFAAGSGGLAFATGYSADTPRAGQQGPSTLRKALRNLAPGA